LKQFATNVAKHFLGKRTATKECSR